MNFSIGITKCKHTNTILINNHAFDQTTSDDDHEETKKSGESSRFNTILETDPYNDRNAIDYNLCDHPLKWQAPKRKTYSYKINEKDKLFKNIK